MAKVEREPGRSAPAFDLSDAEVDARWAELMTNNRPQERITDMWNELGEKYKSLGFLRSD